MRTFHVVSFCLRLCGVALIFHFSPAGAAVGRVVAWGDNTYGQTNVPAGLTNAVAVASGDYHNLALQADGTVVAWGYNAFGQTNVPPGLTNVVAISAGASHSLALQQNGTVVAWGYALDGQTSVPAGLSNVVAISAGHHLSAALKSDGTVVMWPDNFFAIPVPAGLSNVTAIADAGNSDAEHCLALLSDGTMRAWGDDGFGQNDFPPGLTGVVAIAAGGFAGLALRSDGTVLERGQEYGAVYPVPLGLSNVVALDYQVALESNGTVVTWPTNDIAAGLTNVVAISRTLALVGVAPQTQGVPIAGSKGPNGEFSISVPSNSGRVYALEYKASLSDTNWNALPLVAGTGSTLSLRDATAFCPQRFYRVREW